MPLNADFHELPIVLEDSKGCLYGTYVIVERCDVTFEYPYQVPGSASFLARGVWPFFSSAAHRFPRGTSIDNNSGLKTSVRVRGLPL